MRSYNKIYATLLSLTPSLRAVGVLLGVLVPFVLATELHCFFPPAAPLTSDHGFSSSGSRSASSRPCALASTLGSSSAPPSATSSGLMRRMTVGFTVVTTSLVRGEDLLWYFQFQRVSNLLPDLLSARESAVVLEALQVQDEDRRKRIDKYLLLSLVATSAEVTRKSLCASNALQRVDDVVDMRSTNIELQRLVGFEGDRVLLARYAQLRAQMTAKDLGDRRRGVDMSSSAGDSSLLLLAHFQPAIRSRISFRIW
ncbi:hypothetical protein KC333_g126 [Hortaea werneckii]|nr:hypothetical protein KC333_g126 [Hortaea werneckii]